MVNEVAEPLSAAELKMLRVDASQNVGGFFNLCGAHCDERFYMMNGQEVSLVL